MIYMYYSFLIIFLLMASFLCFMILIQESKSMGLGSAFGVDSGDSLFGVSTPDILKKITGWLVGLFFIGCVGLSIWTSSLGRKTSAFDMDKGVLKEKIVEPTKNVEIPVPSIEGAVE